MPARLRFFFFQAEDGIRDLTVTGVQTCALPIFFAGMWDFRRKGWTFRSGGETPTSPSGSGFFKTTDGGATWQELDEKSATGLPAKPWGRIAVAIEIGRAHV